MMTSFFCGNFLCHKVAGILWEFSLALASKFFVGISSDDASLIFCGYFV